MPPKSRIHIYVLGFKNKNKKDDALLKILIIKNLLET